MSIIYDALQKTQEQRQNDHKTSDTSDTVDINKKSFAWVKVISFVLFVSFILAGIFLFLPKKQVVPKKPANIVLAPAPNLILNGIFVSENEKIAAINNQFFHQGDTVLGMKITAISPNSVALKNDKRIMVLQVKEG